MCVFYFAIAAEPVAEWTEVSFHLTAGLINSCLTRSLYFNANSNIESIIESPKNEISHKSKHHTYQVDEAPDPILSIQYS